jgi:hypothetical protein
MASQTYPLNLSKPPKKAGNGGGSGLVSAFSPSGKNMTAQNSEFGPPKPNRSYKVGGNIVMQTFYYKGKLELWIVEFVVDEEGRKSARKVIVLSASEYSIIKDRIREILEDITPSLNGTPVKFSSHKISDTLSVEVEFVVGSNIDYTACLNRTELLADPVRISMTREEFSIEFEKALKNFYFVFSKFPVVYEKGTITRKVLTKCSTKMIRLIRDRYPEVDRFDSGAFENPRFRDAFFSAYTEFMNVHATSVVGEISLDAHDVEACLFNLVYQCMNQLELLCYAMNIFDRMANAEEEKKRYFKKRYDVIGNDGNGSTRTRIPSIGDRFVAPVKPMSAASAAAALVGMASDEDDDEEEAAATQTQELEEGEIVMQQ